MTLRTAPERMMMRLREEPDDTRRSATPVRIFFASVVTGLYDGDVGCIEETYMLSYSTRYSQYHN